MRTILLSLALKKNINLDFKIEPQIENIKADRIKFKQILYNLGNNAIKFTPEEGSVIITGGVSGNMLQISVEDTGIGIPEDRLDEIFIPFKQLQPHLTRKYGGAGLGLSITKHFVELHNGSIHVESELNKGSRVTLYMPVDHKLD